MTTIKNILVGLVAAMVGKRQQRPSVKNSIRNLTKAVNELADRYERLAAIRR